MSRIETGPHQHGNDWPGYFIRGDEAVLGWAQHFRWIADAIERGEDKQLLLAQASWLRRRADELATCWVKE